MTGYLDKLSSDPSLAMNKPNPARAKSPSVERAAASVAAMIDEYKNLGLSTLGKEQLAKLIERRLRRFWPKP